MIEEKVKKWKPRKKQTYFRISYDGWDNVPFIKQDYWAGAQVDWCAYHTNNCFKTEVEALELLLKIKKGAKK